MCSNIGRKRITTRTLYGYKYAPRGESQISPNLRAALKWFPMKGTTVQYEIGKSVTSPSGPGLMIFVSLPKKREYYTLGSWLKVRIPAGVTLRTATHEIYGRIRRIYCVSKVDVLRKIKSNE